jgi:hypothetical protein
VEQEEEEEGDNIYGKFVCISGFVSKWIVDGRESAICCWIGFLLACERKCESSSGPFVA